MAEVINLNRARKARDKARAGAEAQRNRAAFGRTKAEKKAEAEQAAKAQRDLDAKKIEE
jgi:hypothetical protein